MFTGIIQSIGTIAARNESDGGVTFDVNAGELAGQLSPGDSVAVNGVCQTVERVAGDELSFTSVGETLKRTTLDDLRPNDQVNLETAATPETALSGHIVQGHVDGVAVVTSFLKAEKDHLLSIRLPGDLFELSVNKGSIAVDGVSLTIVERVGDDIVTITVIPFTLEQTILKHYRAGTRVNVETDIIGKYVKQFVELRGRSVAGELNNVTRKEVHR